MSRPADATPLLRNRILRPADLGECLALLPQHMGLDAATLARLPALWERLVHEPSIISGVIEDLALPPGQRIQFWGVTMALPPAMVGRLALETAPVGHNTRRIYAALLSGEFAPLTDRELGVLNARGETVLMILHATMPQADLSDPSVHRVVAMAQDCFRRFHDGYRLRALYFEDSAAAEPMVVHSGFAPRRLADHDALHNIAPGERPALYALTRDEARQQLPGTPARHAFEHQPPRFRFNASQRRLLWQALFDEGEEHLVATLEVSVHGLKKLWRGIYERIEDVAPEFFGDAAGALADEARRGPEKRRQVLAYVRQRPEELRPWSAA